MSDLDRRRLAEELFARIVDLPGDRRAAFLDEQCDDPDVREEVERLLVHDAGGRLPTRDWIGTGPTSDSSSSAPQRQRFLPGAMVGDRYRIVALLGCGGMGDVYRADDLKLGQSIALKILPGGLAADPAGLARFRAEVRLARQIGHPNVCRVFDIGESDGLHFLTMEYVDGEDLASLLRRIGRFPRDKALDIARQLCAGLAAAHEQGVLHCDLKPANVMIDGSGRVRIADFGLASAIGSASEDDVRCGTPAYMAPEQLAGSGVSPASDIYAVGLILHEVITGRAVHTAASLAELIEQRAVATPTPSPSQLVDDVDPDLERAIGSCLAERAEDRCHSALALYAALPGGDPLRAAVAAGQTPLPAEVAAAPGRGVMRRSHAGALLAIAIAGLLLGVWLADATRALARTSTLEPGALVDRARTLLDDVRGGGADAPFAAAGFIELPGPRSELRFWYRVGPRPLMPTAIYPNPAELTFNLGRVTPIDPPPTLAGMAAVQLDPRGRLIELQCVPVPSRSSAPTRPTDVDRWRGWCAGVTGLPWTTSPDAEPRLPAVFADWRAVWVAGGLRMDAAFLDGRPVALRAGDAGLPAGPDLEPVVAGSAQAVWLLFVLLLVAGLSLARRNLRAGRGDRRGAAILARVTFALLILQWLFGASHVADLSELRLLVFGLARSAYVAGVYWLWYLAMEPYVRRIWPETLIAWSRLLSGRIRDSSVGRNALAGAAGGVVILLLSQLDALSHAWFQFTEQAAMSVQSEALQGARFAASEFVIAPFFGVEVSLILLLSLLLVRAVVRHTGTTAVIVTVLFTVLFTLAEGHPAIALPLRGAIVALVVFVLLRVGLLACVVLLFVRSLLNFPITADLDAWYAGTGLVAIAAVAAIALAGFLAVQRGRPRLEARLTPP